MTIGVPTHTSEITVEINNHTKYIDLTWSCVTDDDENVTQVILVMKDVTILKDLEMNAKKAVYDDQTNIIELFSKVKIVKGQEIITGDYGILDTNKNSYKVSSKNSNKVKAVISNKNE